MRLGLQLPPVASMGWPAWAGVVRAAETVGLDAVAIRDSADESALVLAAALPGLCTQLRVIVEIDVLGHPLHLAEQIAVADQLVGGRLAVSVAGGGNDERTAEAIEIIRLGLRARPFRHSGQHWQVPARLPANENSIDESVRVTPPPLALEVPLWASDRVVADLAGTGWLAGPDDDPEAFWSGRESGTRPALRHARADLRELAVSLAAERDAWGLDLAVLSADTPGGWTPDSVVQLARHVRPRIQLERLPAGVTGFWDATLLDDATD